MRGQRQSNHREESCGPAFVKTVDGKLNSIDMMPAGAQKPRTKTTSSKSVNEFGKKRDAAPGRHRCGDQSEEGHSGNYDQDFACYRRHGIGKEHQASAAENEQHYRKIVEQVINYQRGHAVN